jgi:TonB family protein
MRTTTFDFRGSGVDAQPESVARGASLSMLIHGVGLSAMVLAPLLLNTEAPEPVTTTQNVLVKPITVTLPAAARGVSAARKSGAMARARRAASAAAPPKDTPTSLTIESDLLDTRFGPPVADESGEGPGEAGGEAGGTCALGALCGEAAVPMTEKTPARTPRVGGLIREPRLIEGKAPEYPPIAQVAGLSADVILEAHVGRDGRILSAEIVKGHPLFDDAAVASVRSRRYEPLLLNGVPSDFLVTITVSFRIRR